MQENVVAGYRRNAEQCRLQAAAAMRDADRAAWLQMCRKWQELADGVEMGTIPILAAL